ncbi:pimeloyl-ACP methyl ester carboxylesterase [Catenuloplanes nepalensis]|uniref:Pimeloyl-ACP methyl ester carboxylesterase n=1 Tax=Catenuloplanes nepalensis TaxID=587533 RepID=A0ABT9MN87_9ACTN|nr:alpha/beta hydrolase [Catenuloplanes nepalensis]MDP9792850.1 pimeloyl-ACP methyl ester carboxylesterase [Catenuloplanes nepalensis]
MGASDIPVILIHGLWVHASSWDPWIERFRAAGFAPAAPGWPGDGDTAAGTRTDPGRLAGVGLDELVAHYGRIVDALDTPPIVIGHSVGGLVAQRLNATYTLRAAVAISPAPVKGVRPVPLAQLRSSFPALRWPGNIGRTVPLTAAQFRYAFGNTLTGTESDDLHARYAIPGPARPLFEIATANLRRRSPAAVDTGAAGRAPLLMIAAEQDHTVPAVVVRAAHRLHRDADLVSLPDRGHSLVFDHGWAGVAERVETWLEERVTGPLAAAGGDAAGDRA